MGFHGLTSIVYQGTLWIARLAYLNVLWVVFTILGLGLLGIFPATAATFSLVRLWLQNRSAPILRRFWSEYKHNFSKSNRLGWSVVPFFAIVIILLRWSLMSDGSLSIIVTLLTTVCIIIISFYSLYLFPVFTHYDVEIKDIYKYTFYISVSYPHYAIGIIIVWLLMVFTFFYTGFLLFFFSSLTVFIVMFGAQLAFNKIQLKQTMKHMEHV